MEWCWWWRVHYRPDNQVQRIVICCTGVRLQVGLALALPRSIKFESMAVELCWYAIAVCSFFVFALGICFGRLWGLEKSIEMRGCRQEIECYAELERMPATDNGGRGLGTLRRSDLQEELRNPILLYIPESGTSTVHIAADCNGLNLANIAKLTTRKLCGHCHRQLATRGLAWKTGELNNHPKMNPVKNKKYNK